jgi:hypothetical protein
MQILVGLAKSKNTEQNLKTPTIICTFRPKYFNIEKKLCTPTKTRGCHKKPKMQFSYSIFNVPPLQNYFLRLICPQFGLPTIAIESISQKMQLNTPAQ